MTKKNPKKIRVNKMLKELRRLFPDGKTVLRYKNPWELLVSVILSAQCTDERVNEVTKQLFKKYKKLEDYVSVNQTEFEKDIKPTGFYKNKAKNILKTAKILKNNFDNKIPDNMKDIITLPGVGRKTANIILSSVFNKTEGIAVDTHVRRLSIKFGLTKHADPIKIEKDLMLLLPRKNWSEFSSLLVKYGQNICSSRRHDCKTHPLTKIYAKAKDIWPKAK